MSSNSLKQVSEEEKPVVPGDVTPAERLQSLNNNDVNGQMPAKKKGYNKVKIALIAVTIFILVGGGIAGGLIYYFLEVAPVKYQEGRIQEFQTNGRECFSVQIQNTQQKTQDKTEQCANKEVSSQLITLKVSNTSVTKMMVIRNMVYQFDNGTNYTLPGVNLYDLNTTTMRFLQSNDDSQVGDINQVPNALIVTDKNDTVQSVGFPVNTDANYRTAILQQVYNVQINPTNSQTGLTNLGNLNASSDTPNRRIRILQSDGSTNQGQGPIVNASQHATLDPNGNVNQSNVTQSQVITSQNPDNSTTTIQGNSSSTLTCTQQDQASNATLDSIQQLTAQQNISFYSAQNISEAILPTKNYTNNNQTNSSQQSQNPEDQSNLDSNEQGSTNQTSQDNNNSTLSQEAGVDGNSSNRLLFSQPQTITLAQFSKTLISADFLGVNFNANIDASARLRGWTLLLDYNNYCIVNGRYIILIRESQSYSSGARPIQKNFGRTIEQNLISQVFIVFGYPIFLSVNSQINYGFTLLMRSPGPSLMQAIFQPYASYGVNAQAYTSFFVLEVGLQAKGDLAKVSASFNVNANLVARQSTATAVATISQNLNLNGYYSYLRCELSWRRVCWGRRWWRVCVRYPYISCSKSSTQYLFNTYIFSPSRSLTLYSRNFQW